MSLQLGSLILSGQDIILLLTCPLFTMLGTMVSTATKKINSDIEYGPRFLEVDTVKLRENMQLFALGKHTDRTLEEVDSAFADLETYTRKPFRDRNTVQLAFVGFVLGLVIALYFVGALSDNINSVARILGLCVLLGYQAPSVWVTQESTIKKLIDKHLAKVVEANSPRVGETDKPKPNGDANTD